MSTDKYKDQFASAASRAFRSVYPEVFQQVGNREVFNSETIYQALEKPKDPKMGRFALPVFRFVRLLKDKPQVIASRVAEESNRLLTTNGGSRLLNITAASGFLNAQVDFVSMATDTVGQILSESERYGGSTRGNGKTVLVEYSSPNIAKPFGVGHLRTTIIGNSLRLIFKKLGYHVVGINYPGDWGTQFGKMIVAYRKWGDESTLSGRAVENLLELYVRFLDHFHFEYIFHGTKYSARCFATPPV